MDGVCKSVWLGDPTLVCRVWEATKKPQRSAANRGRFLKRVSGWRIQRIEQEMNTLAPQKETKTSGFQSVAVFCSAPRRAGLCLVKWAKCMTIFLLYKWSSKWTMRWGQLERNNVRSCFGKLGQGAASSLTQSFFYRRRCRGYGGLEEGPTKRKT